MSFIINLDHIKKLNCIYKKVIERENIFFNLKTYFCLNFYQTKNNTKKLSKTNDLYSR